LGSYKILYGGDTNSVQSDPPFLSGFLFSQYQVIPRLQGSDLAGSDGYQIRCAQICIAADNKQSVVSGIIFQKFFDGLDVLQVLEWSAFGGEMNFPVSTE